MRLKELVQEVEVRLYRPFLFRAPRFDGWLWLARRLPHRLVYWCAIVAGAHATTGKYGSTVVPELTFVDVLQRYGQDHGITSRPEGEPEEDEPGVVVASEDEQRGMENLALALQNVYRLDPLEAWRGANYICDVYNIDPRNILAYQRPEQGEGWQGVGLPLVLWMKDESNKLVYSHASTHHLDPALGAEVKGPEWWKQAE